MDDVDEFRAAEKNPKNYIKERAGHWVAIDECQVVPGLFGSLKEHVRTHPKPGQFILSGSVRFTSRKAIKESLTGRIINLELLPMLMTELYELELGSFWRDALASQSFTRFSHGDISVRPASIEKYFKTGGLPGICFIREDLFRERKIESQLETILDRDIRMIVQTTLTFPSVMLLLKALADRQGAVLSMTELRSDTGISVPTIKKLLFAFESVFLIRTIPVEGDGKGPVVYFEDMAERQFLCGRETSLAEQMAHFLHLHIRGEWLYSGTSGLHVFNYRTRAGVDIPLAIRHGANSLGIIPITGQSPTRVESGAADSFLRKYNQSKVVFIGLDAKPKVLDDRRLVTALGRTFS
jgi:predicted AAA+ superfamily ATPase